MVYCQTDFDKISFHHYKMSDGLSGNKISQIKEDSRNQIWISTEAGLSRFDGISFFNVTQSDGFTSFNNYDIREINFLNDSTMSLRTPEGCGLMNLFTFKTKWFFYKDTSVFSDISNCTFDFFRLPNGNYIMHTKTGVFEFTLHGKLVYKKLYYPDSNVDIKSFMKESDWNEKDAYRIENDICIYYANKKCFAINHFNHKEYRDYRIRSFELFKDNSVLRKQISSNEFIFLDINSDSIFYFNYKTGLLKGSLVPFNTASEFYSMNNFIFDLGNDEFVVTSYNGGFFSFKLNFKKEFEFDINRYKEDFICTYVLRDSNGRLWIGTYNGLLKEINHNSFIKTFDITSEKNSQNTYNIIYPLNNKIFISNSSSDFCLIVLDANTKEILHQMNFYPEDVKPFLPFKLCSFYKDTLWISANSGVLWLNTNNYSYGKVNFPKELGEINIKSSFANNKGDVWMHNQRLELIRYNIHSRSFVKYILDSKEKSFNPNVVTNVIDDNYNHTWFSGYGIQRWNYDKEKIDTTIGSFGKIGQNVDFFEFVDIDNYDRLWVNLTDYGFLRYNLKNHKTDMLDLRKFAAGKVYSSFSRIVNDNLWFGCSDHLVRINVRSEKLNLFNQNDGMPDEAFRSNIVFNAQKNEYYACMSGGKLISFSGKESSNRKKIILEYFSTSPTIINYCPNDTIRLQHNFNTVTLKFTIIDYDLKYPRKFLYSIDESESWNTINQTQPVFLYDLAVGWHKITVKPLYNKDQLEELSIYVYIIPPFWKTIWFIVLLNVLIISSTFMIVRLVIRKIKKENNLLLQLKEFEIKALHAQMNPHFIFNCLNGIKALIMQEKTKEASKYMNAFSKLVRLNLTHSRKPFISLKENIDYIDLYLQSENLRYTNFEYYIEVEDDIDIENIQVVPMLLQPIVENAIWHGLQSIQSKRILVIKFEKENSIIKIIIEDNGIGIRKSLRDKNANEKESVGMLNIKERISLYNQKYKVNYRIEVIDKSDIHSLETGTIVIIYFNTYENT